MNEGPPYDQSRRGSYRAERADAMTVGRTDQNRAIIMFDVLTENLNCPVKHVCYELRSARETRLLGTRLLQLADRIEECAQEE